MPIVSVPSTMYASDPRFASVLFSDMNSAADWTNFATGGANLFTSTGLNDGGRVGILESQTSTSATANAGIGNNPSDAVVFGTKAHRLSAVCKIPTLSSAAQTFYVTIGFHDARTAAAATDGVYFQYIHSTFSGNWAAMSYSAGGSLTAATDTGIAADTGWHTFDIFVNADATVAQFFIDGVLRATRSTAASDSIPSGTARATAVTVQILKSVGTTSRSLYTDSLLLEVDSSR